MSVLQCDGRNRTVSPLPYLRRRADSDVAVTRGRLVWSLAASRGRFGVHCLLTRPVAHRACEVGGSSSVVVANDDRPGHRSTLVAAAGPRLGGLEVRGPEGLNTGIPLGPSRNAGVVLAGHVEPSALRVVLVERGGRRRTVATGAAQRASAPDPAGSTPWTARSDGQCAGYRHDASRFGGYEGEPGNLTCGRDRRVGFYFSVERAVCYVDPCKDALVLWGAASARIASVSAGVDPDALRPLRLARRGRAFIAVFPSDTPTARVTMRVVFRDGSSNTFVGRRSANVD